MIGWLIDDWLVVDLLVGLIFLVCDAIGCFDSFIGFVCFFVGQMTDSVIEWIVGTFVDWFDRWLAVSFLVAR